MVKNVLQDGNKIKKKRRHADNKQQTGACSIIFALAMVYYFNNFGGKYGNRS